MAVERRNPLPVGRYWIAFAPEHAPSFNAWWAANRGLVSIEQAKLDPASHWEFTIFRVTGAASRFPSELGFPNVAGKDVIDESSAVQAPVIDTDVVPSLPDVAASAASLGKWLALALVACAVLKLLPGTTRT